MAHKHQAKGRNRRRTANKQRNKAVVLSQQKFRGFVSNLQISAVGLIASQEILTLAPNIFNVKHGIATGQLDKAKLAVNELLTYGQQIVNEIPDLRERSLEICKEISTFIEDHESVNVGGLSPAALVELTSTMFNLQKSCEQWNIDFSNNIRHPLMESVSIINNALTNGQIDIGDALESTRAILKLTTETEQAGKVE